MNTTELVPSKKQNRVRFIARTPRRYVYMNLPTNPHAQFEAHCVDPRDWYTNNGFTGCWSSWKPMIFFRHILPIQLKKLRRYLNLDDIWEWYICCKDLGSIDSDGCYLQRSSLLEFYHSTETSWTLESMKNTGGMYSILNSGIAYWFHDRTISNIPSLPCSPIEKYQLWGEDIHSSIQEAYR